MSFSNIDESLKITAINAKDMRWPTSLGGHGSDAMHTDPDYSCVYVTIKTNQTIEGYGLAFTCGRGNEIVQLAVKALSTLCIGRYLRNDIYARFGLFWRELTSDSQIRWIGPEKGVMHLAVAAIINALWDLLAKLEKKPLWRLLTDMEPELLVSTVDFRYITDVITPAEAVEMLKEAQKGKQQRIDELLKHGYPCYTTQIGWLGYTDEYRRQLCRKYLSQGFDAFKLKVGQNLEEDRHRCQLVREEIGWEKKLMVDANQVWNVNEAIEWMKKLSDFKIWWIEEPTSPDDALGHATIAKALKPLDIGVASGEMCMNRIMFKQFLQANALEFCQIDSARIGGVNEILSVYFMCNKFGVKVCPHAGGVGLCEMVQHLQMWDFCSVSCTKTDRYIEYVDQQHDQFVHPSIVKNAHYQAPTVPGYSTELKTHVIAQFEYPNGSEWQCMFKEGLVKHIQY